MLEPFILGDLLLYGFSRSQLFVAKNILSFHTASAGSSYLNEGIS